MSGTPPEEPPAVAADDVAAAVASAEAHTQQDDDQQPTFEEPPTVADVPTAPRQRLAVELVAPRIKQGDPTLWELDLSGPVPPLSDADVEALEDALSHARQLRRLSFAEARLGPEAVAAVLRALARNPSLLQLDLSQAPIDRDDPTVWFDTAAERAAAAAAAERADAALCVSLHRGLLALLLADNHTLCEVVLPPLPLEVDLAEGAAAARRIAPSLLASRAADARPPPAISTQIAFAAELNRYPLQMKDVVFRAFLNDDAHFLLEVKYTPSDVKTHNEGAIRAIVAALADNTTVRLLRLDRCCCRSEACLKELCPLLEGNTTIAKLGLAHNHLSAQSIVWLVAALRRNPHSALEEIDLSHNELDDEAAACLVDLLQVNHAIRAVNVEGNPKITAPWAERLRCSAALNNEPSMLKECMWQLRDNDPAFTVLTFRGQSESRRGLGKGQCTSLSATTLADVMRFNTCVHTIDFSDNHIGPDGARALAQTIRTHPALTSLDLSRNPLHDEGVRHLATALEYNDLLVFLGLDGCGASPKLVSEAEALTRLNAQPLPLKQYFRACVATTPVAARIQQQQQQQQGTAAAVPAALDFSYATLTQLRKAAPANTVRGKWPTLRAESMPYVCAILRGAPHVAELTVADNIDLGDRGLAPLIIALATPEGSRGLCKLNISNTGISSASVAALTAIMPGNYVLSTVFCNGNSDVAVRPRDALEAALELNAFPAAVKDAVPLLRANVAGLVVLDLSLESFRGARTPLVGDDACRVLMAALRTNTTVTTVSFACQSVSNRGVGYICESLGVVPDSSYRGPRNASITHLDLSGNGISAEGAAQLATDVLETNLALRTLSLSRNRIGETGGQGLLGALRPGSGANRTLTALHVAECGLSAATERTLATFVLFNRACADFRGDVLERVGALTDVSFRGSVGSGFVDDDGCDALVGALALAPHHRVCRIDLPGNRFTAAGLRALARAVRATPTVTSLGLSGNAGIDTAEGNAVLAELAEEAPHLTEVTWCAAAVDGQSLEGGGHDGEPSAPLLDLRAPALLRALRLNRQAPPFREAYRRLALRLLGHRRAALAVVAPAAAPAVPASSASEPLLAVELGGLGADDDGVALVLELLAAAPQQPLRRSLRLLDLSDNRIGDAGAAAVAAAFDAAPTTCEADTGTVSPSPLPLAVVGAPTPRAGTLVPAVASGPPLQALYLDGNADIGAAGAAALATLAWAWPSVCVVSLGGTAAAAGAARHSAAETGVVSEAGLGDAAGASAGAADDAACSSALGSLATKLAANRALLPSGAMLLSQRQRRVLDPRREEPALVLALAPGVATADELRHAEARLMEEALRDLPPRKPYVRGQYAYASRAAGRR